MKDIDFRLASVEYSDLGLAWTAATEEFKKTEDEITELHAALGKVEATIEESRADALAAEHELSTLQRSVHETEAALSRAEHKVEMSKSQIAAFTEQRGRDLSDVEYLKTEIARSAEQRALQEREANVLGESIAEQNALLEQKNAVLEELAGELRERERTLEEARHGVYSALNEAAAEKTKIANLQSWLIQLDEQDDRAAQEGQELAAKLRELGEMVAQKEREREEIAARRKAAMEERAVVSARLAQSLEKKKTLEADLASARNRLAGQGSRLRSLLELEQRLEGYQKGVRTVMSARKEAAAGDRIGTIYGLVADMIETEPRYETAIEAVLGDRLQYVVVDSQTDSLKAIEFLRTQGGGRSTFVPRTTREVKSEPFVKNGRAGVIGSALSIVRCNDQYRSVAQYLLGDVVVVDTMDTALYLWNKEDFDKTVVTLSGEILDPWGAVTGGAADAGGSGMLTTRREIKDLEHEVSELKTLASGLDTELVSLNASIESDRRTEADLSQRIHRDEIELVNRDKDCASVRDEISRATDRSRNIEAEAAERASKRQELNASIMQSAETLRGLEAGHASAQETIENLQEELGRHKERLESARAEITEVRMALASLTEKQAAAARNVSLFLTAEAELAERLAKRNAEIESISAKLTELEASIIEAESEIKGQIEVLDADRRTLVMKQEAYGEKARIVHAAEEQARAKRHDLEAVQKRLSTNEVRRTELRMKIEHLKARIWTAYHTELETIVQELGQFELNVEEAAQRAGELREKIDQMGPINVDALQEYNELKERFDLLSSQQNDINESIGNLKATIAKLDGETIELFSEAFNVIQEKFKEVFALLFEGGKAELVLLDPSNILESGIEIIAQPRGKKFQSITLLSGGERALTAIALLFAAFLVKPSPFCMLDEVDAPLDEANVTRFTRLIREMSSRSQFITITHNKRTMEMADALYGITMEEPGCSRVISAKLREPALV